MNMTSSELSVSQSWNNPPDRPLANRLMFHPTLTINGFHGGYGGPGSKAIVPNEAVVKCDARLVGQQKPDDILAKIEAHVKKYAPNVEFVRVESMLPSKTPLDSPFSEIVRRAVHIGQGVEPLIYPSIGGSLPEYVFTKILGTHSFVVPYANADEANHAPNENITIDCFVNGIRTGAALLDTLGEFEAGARSAAPWGPTGLGPEQDRKQEMSIVIHPRYLAGARICEIIDKRKDQMPTAFPKEEYQERLKKLRTQMTDQGVNLLVATDPAHLNYLSGFDSWSYQNTQALLVPKQDAEPVWVGRGVDKGGACHTTWLSPDNIVAYDDFYSDSHSQHAMEAVAEEIKKRGWNSGRIGYEGDTYYFSPRAFFALKNSIPEAAEWIDIGLLINELKTIKSPREIEFMRKAGRITDRVMQVAIDYLEPGIRENELAGRVLRAQAEGAERFVGAIPSAPPFILSGTHISYPHTPFTNDVIEQGSYTALELGGCYMRYNTALCRTVSLGKPSGKLLRVGSIVQEGLEAAMSVVKPGVTCHDVWAAWQAVLEREGYRKYSRIGYSLGLNYHPTWRDHTASLRKGEEIELQAGMCFHMICGMWAGDGTKEGNANYELSETVLVTSKGIETLTNLERKLFVKE